MEKVKYPTKKLKHILRSPSRYNTTTGLTKSHYNLIRRSMPLSEIFSGAVSEHVSHSNDHKKYQPSIIYVSDIINESLYRKYHAETFDLLPQAVIAFAKIYQIKLVVLRRDRQPGSLIRSYFSLLTTDLFHLYKSSRFTQALPNARRKLVISASDYHLLNLRSFKQNATKKCAMIIIEKANPESKKQLDQSVMFTDVYQYITIPKYLFIVL